MNAAPGLQKRLNQRQLNMIAIGGVIGAGLFTGSSAVLATTATAGPSTGSFAGFAREAPGGWAGFSVGLEEQP